MTATKARDLLECQRVTPRGTLKTEHALAGVAAAAAREAADDAARAKARAAEDQS